MADYKDYAAIEAQERADAELRKEGFRRDIGSYTLVCLSCGAIIARNEKQVHKDFHEK